ncbi:DEAD-box ATP-dependent RNA helicase 52A isoform X1 [Triticum aestivum]|uniref:DEAD-box ATP-dependent RNA helicase 52A isoform X1 n=1 Tax=Triticum aestivum TaxID=4565 RepID=UPI001D032849|nr:DEAD-box ATP-dependent RNA helicase 52A-like isoform X1 [Triticum aestivum]
MASSDEWGDDAAGGEWTTVTRSGRPSHAGAAGRSPNAKRAAPRPPKPAAPTVGEVGEGLAGLDVDGASRTGRLDKYDIPVEVSGDGAPAPADGFEQAGLAEAVLRNVARCGYDNPTPVQRYSIPIVLSGRDLMACAQTGSGKTAAFCLPVVSGLVSAAEGGQGGEVGRGDRDAYDYDYRRVARPLALVLAPTRELAAQINEEAKKFAHKTGLKVKVAYGGTSMVQQQLRDIEKGADILVATPGRLVDMIERGKISLEAIKYLIMDEADRMLDMGFEPQIRKIVDGMGMPRKSVRQTMLFSATFPPEIQRLASDFLSKYIFITVGRVGSSTDLITQQVEFVTHDEKRTYLIDLLQKQSFTSSDGKPQQPLTLVFVETKREADSLRYWLYNKGFPATAIHGDRTQEERESALRSFKSGLTPVMVATDVVARGLDVPNVAHVINYDLPKSIEDYVHRIGRTGRAGNAGSATAFFTESNHPIAKGLLELMTEAKQNVPTWLEDYAGKPFYGGSSFGGRGRRSNGDGGSSFGGRDYRGGGDYSGYSGGAGGGRSYSGGSGDRGDSYSGGGGGDRYSGGGTGDRYSGGGGGGGDRYSGGGGGDRYFSGGGGGDCYSGGGGGGGDRYSGGGGGDRYSGGGGGDRYSGGGGGDRYSGGGGGDRYSGGGGKSYSGGGGGDRYSGGGGDRYTGGGGGDSYSSGGGGKSYSGGGGGGRYSSGGGSSRESDPPPRYYPSYPMGTSNISASGWD